MNQILLALNFHYKINLCRYLDRDRNYKQNFHTLHKLCCSPVFPFSDRNFLKFPDRMKTRNVNKLVMKDFDSSSKNNVL